MEPFSGELLSDILAARRAVPLSAAIDLSLQAAAGLTAAHAAGVVHGIVSPETMLLTRTADGHRLKLIGFSVALFVGGSRNGGRENAGYASPEQRRGVAADDQSDVYSLAAVLHHLVSGAPPEAGGVVAESIPRRLKAVLEKALADTRSDRYPTMAAFATLSSASRGLMTCGRRSGGDGAVSSDWRRQSPWWPVCGCCGGRDRRGCGPKRRQERRCRPIQWFSGRSRGESAMRRLRNRQRRPSRSSRA